ncbi:hypothetical protein KAT80_02675 [Candidatus Pacearchaeota archaeon]|nr:hypothetical protein [Candidatus Pacearchaeota archaeon]
MIEINNFVEGIKLFYSTFLKSTSDSIRVLAKIQEEHSEEYNKLKEVQNDPSILLDNIGDLTEEEKDKLITIFFRVAKLERKMLKLFDLSAEDKEKLAKEIDSFLETLNANIGKK